MSETESWHVKQTAALETFQTLQGKFEAERLNGLVFKGTIVALAELHGDYHLPWKQRQEIRLMLRLLDSAGKRVMRGPGRFEKLTRGYDYARKKRISQLATSTALAYCARCSRGLTNPHSVQRGIGPICWGHVMSEKRSQAEGETEVTET